ncbi:HNH endonuclease [Streptomyces sp. MMS24-I29]|uniref:HNH endonuclease n=1 Tax=Streptomyces sp. MMS24-I29 TaxID=3351480 RepID=UPI003C7ADE0D
MRHGHPLNSVRRRTRKEQLARRHGWRCTYCRRPFTAPREATLDHIVPVSLYRTWAVVNLTLACGPCNHAKADQLPLSIALLLVWAQGRDQRDETRHTRSHAPRHTDQLTGHQVHEVDVPPVDWRLLARLAHAHHTATDAPRTASHTPPAVTRTATRTVTRTPARTGCDLPVHRERTDTRTATRAVTVRPCGNGRTPE